MSDEFNVEVTQLPPGPGPSDEVILDVDKAIKDFCVEMSNSMLRTEAERDFRKDAIDNLFEKTKVPKSTLNFCARTYHKSDFDEKTKASQERQEFYIRLFGEPMGDSNDDDTQDE